MSYTAYISSAPSTQASIWQTSFGTSLGASARRGEVGTTRICWATVRDGLALAAMFGSFYCWLWLGWAIAPT